MVVPNTIEIPASSDDIFAATRVVSLIPGDGTDLTIAAAIANLPAGGGMIFVKQGLYALPVALSTALPLPDKPVEIVGAGRGATILSIAGAADGTDIFRLAFNRKYAFRSFTLQGTLGSLHIGWRALGGSALTVANPVVIEDVDSDNLHVVMVGLPSGQKYKIANCDFPRPDVIAGGIQSRLSTSNSGELEMVNVTAVAATAVNDPGGIANNPTVRAVDCRLTGIVFLGDDSTFTACEILDISTASSGNAVGARNRFVGCKFRNTSAPTYWLNAFSFFGVDLHVEGCDFGAASVAALRTSSSNGRFIGNKGFKAHELVDSGTPDANLYSNNAGFDGSTIIGLTSIVTDWNVRSVAVDTTLNETHRTVVVDASGAARTITLPTAALSKYRQYTIKKTDATVNTVTIDADGAETIDGSLTFVLTVQYQALEIQSDGTTWWIV